MRDAKDALAALVRNSRHERDLTQEDLAERLKLGLRTITDIEKGRGNPKYETMVVLQRFLMFSTDPAVFGNDAYASSECESLFREVSALPDKERRVIEAAVKAMLKEYNRGEENG